MYRGYRYCDTKTRRGGSFGGREGTVSLISSFVDPYIEPDEAQNHLLGAWELKPDLLVALRKGPD